VYLYTDNGDKIYAWEVQQIFKAKFQLCPAASHLCLTPKQPSFDW